MREANPKVLPWYLAAHLYDVVSIEGLPSLGRTRPSGPWLIRGSGQRPGSGRR